MEPKRPPITLDTLYRQHRQIVAMKRHIVSLVAKPPYPSVDELTSLRWELVQRVDLHLTHEELLVRIPLTHSEDHLARALGHRYEEAMIDFRLGTTAHAGKWTMRNVERDWDGYYRSAQEQLSLIENRVEWEEDVIYPVIEEMIRVQGSGLAA